MGRVLLRVVAVLLPFSVYGAARLPTMPAGERAELASQFKFDVEPLGALPSPNRQVRDVNPSVQHIAGWISSVGASVSLADIDGDGLSNDACLVDTRADRVTLEPVPGSGSRYAPIVLANPVPPPGGMPLAPMGCRLGDYNEDGLSDALVFYWGWTPVAYLRRAAMPSGEQATPGTLTAAPLTAEQFRAIELVDPAQPRWNTNALTAADIDGDGHVDLVVGNYFRDDERMLDPKDPKIVEMQNSMSRAFNGGANRIMLWTGGSSGPEPTVTFAAQTSAFTDEVARGWTLAVGAADLDGDMLPEVYFANDFGPDRLLHNRSTPGKVEFQTVEGVRRLTTPASKVVGRDSFKGMGVDFGDLNGDGWLDIYVSNIANEAALQESHFAFISEGDVPASFRRGVAPYVDRSEELGLSRSGFSWEARLGDFNNDGVLEAMQAVGFVRGTVNRWAELQELAMGNNLTIQNPAHWPRFSGDADISGNLHNPFFVRGPSGRYYDLAVDVGLGRTQVARGIATGDIDGDGRLDFAVANQWASAELVHNRTPSGLTGMGLRLLLPVDNPLPGAAATRPANGATARITLADGRKLIGQVTGGNGHSGGSAPELHFGLGKIAPGAPVRVDVTWRTPSGDVMKTTQSIPAPAPPSASADQESRIRTIVLTPVLRGDS
jgi:enediyne biosynthesis protein E4